MGLIKCALSLASGAIFLTVRKEPFNLLLLYISRVLCVQTSDGWSQQQKEMVNVYWQYIEYLDVQLSFLSDQQL